MQKVHFAAVFLLLFVLSCRKYEEILPENAAENNTAAPINFRVFSIDKGEHHSVNTLKRFYGKSLEFEAYFDETAEYSTSDINNQYDINKLYGFSDCSSAHHSNSARFGWRWENGKISVFAYTYVDKQRESVFLISFPVKTIHHFKIKKESSSYVFTVDDITLKMKRGCDSREAGYYLFPYFGGDETAPHNMKIYIDEK